MFRGFFRNHRYGKVSNYLKQRRIAHFSGQMMTDHPVTGCRLVAQAMNGRGYAATAAHEVVRRKTVYGHHRRPAE